LALAQRMDGKLATPFVLTIVGGIVATVVGGLILDRLTRPQPAPQEPPKGALREPAKPGTSWRTYQQSKACLERSGLREGEHFREVGGRVEIRPGLLDRPEFRDRQAAVEVCK
jgi:hypothetical protein